MNDTDRTTAGRPRPAGTDSPRPSSTPSPPPQRGGDHSPHHDARFNRTTVGWGLIVGVANAAAPLTMWWLDASTVHALAITLIASVYIGFAVADGRPHVIAVECGVAALFVILAAAAITVSPWLLVAAYAGHGLKDLWQHRTHFVTGTRWWPPFCLTIDWVVAAIIAIAIGAGIGFS